MQIAFELNLNIKKVVEEKRIFICVRKVKERKKAVNETIIIP